MKKSLNASNSFYNSQAALGNVLPVSETSPTIAQVAASTALANGNPASYVNAGAGLHTASPAVTPTGTYSLSPVAAELSGANGTIYTTAPGYSIQGSNVVDSQGNVVMSAAQAYQQANLAAGLENSALSYGGQSYIQTTGAIGSVTQGKDGNYYMAVGNGQGGVVTQ